MSQRFICIQKGLLKKKQQNRFDLYGVSINVLSFAYFALVSLTTSWKEKSVASRRNLYWKNKLTLMPAWCCGFAFWRVKGCCAAPLNNLPAPALNLILVHITIIKAINKSQALPILNAPCRSVCFVTFSQAIFQYQWQLLQAFLSAESV